MEFKRTSALVATCLLFAGCVSMPSAPDRQPSGELAAVMVIPDAPPQPAAHESSSVAEVVESVALEIPSDICLPPRDLWSRIRDGFALPDHDHPRIEADLKWYARHPHYLDRVAERATPYLHLIVEQVETRGMPMEIVLLPVVESAFQPFAYSHGRAAGLWQFVPGTGRRFGLRQTWWYDGRRDVAESTRAALDYLSYLHRHFDGDWLLALAAYNSGEGTVQAAMRRNRAKGKPTDFWSLDLPDETRGYVPRLLAISSIVDNPAAHGAQLISVPDEPFLTSVDVDGQIDLDLAAELAGVSLEDIYRYNPGFNRWATDPDGPHKLLIPLEREAQFTTALAKYPPTERIKWVRHQIRSGESLGLIAEQYRTTTKLLKGVNGLNSETIRAGATLVVPVARKDLSRYRLTADQRLQALQERDREGHKLEYQVQPGDTLWDIARSHNVGVGSLAKWNGMAPRDPLHPGQRLVIWTDKAPTTQASLNPVAFQHPFEQSARRLIGYTVRSGDSLYRIAERFRVSVDNIVSWNGLQGSKYLQPGQRLKLYVDVTRQSGSI